MYTINELKFIRGCIKHQIKELEVQNSREQIPAPVVKFNQEIIDELVSIDRKVSKDIRRKTWKQKNIISSKKE